MDKIKIYHPSELISVKDIAAAIGCTPQTVRRQSRIGGMSGLEWIDAYGTGRPKATRKSFLTFLKDRQEETTKRLNPRPYKKS